MKVYVRAANVADIQAKIAKKQADIDKKNAWIQKKEDAITKKLALLKGQLNDEDYANLAGYIDLLKQYDSYKLPEGPRANTWGLVKQYGFTYDDKYGKALYSIDEDAESIYNSKKAIKEFQEAIDKYTGQLDAIKQKDKQVDEIPEVLKDFMNQLIDAWDKFDMNIRDKSPAFYKSCKAKMDELIPRDLYSSEQLQLLFEMYPKYAEDYERYKNDSYRRYYVEKDVKARFEGEYLNTPFKKEFGVSVEQARRLWDLSDEQIHADNVKAGKQVILDLVNRVTKVTGPITSWSGLHATAGNGGWTVLNGIVEGEEGKASVETILAGGYNIQRLHARTLVHAVR